MNCILQSSLAALALGQLALHADPSTPVFQPDGNIIVLHPGSFSGGFVNPIVPIGSGGIITGGPGNLPADGAGSTVSLPITPWDNSAGVDFSSVSVPFSFGTPPVFFDDRLVFSLGSTNPAIYGPETPAPETPIVNLSLPQIIPEPPTMTLAALGLGGLFFFSRRN